jgi:hypothetical protein
MDHHLVRVVEVARHLAQGEVLHQVQVAEIMLSEAPMMVAVELRTLSLLSIHSMYLRQLLKLQVRIV